LGIDLGTTGLKAAIFDAQGGLCGLGYQRCAMLPTGRGRAEQDPEHWWEACQRAVRQAIAAARIEPREVTGVGLSGFHHCPVFLGSQNRPVCPTIITHDQRLRESWRELAHTDVLGQITARSGSMVSQGHFPPIFHYVRTHDPEMLRQTRHIVLPKDYLRLKLTGVLGTEICDATGTNLVKMPEDCWSPDLCALAEVPTALLPPIRLSHEVCQEVTPEAAAATGLAAGTPVVYGGGDSHCALLGLGVIRSGEIGLLLGTNGTMRAVFKGFAKHPQHKVWVQQHVVPGMFTVSASTMAGASVLEWFKNNFCLDMFSRGEREGYDAVQQAVASVPAGSDGLVFNPYIFGERSPFCNPQACATFSGITYLHTRGHFLRSVLEGVACCIAECMELIEQVAAPRHELMGAIRLGGGGSRIGLWPSIISSVLGKPITVVKQPEAGCLGAAMLAGIGTGIYRNCQEAVEQCVGETLTFEPDLTNRPAYLELLDRFKRLRRVVEPEFFR
jgi:xylulokinase